MRPDSRPPAEFGTPSKISKQPGGRAPTSGDDPSADDFAEHQLEPMIPKIKMALDAIGRMHQLLTEAQRDCDN